MRWFQRIRQRLQRDGLSKNTLEFSENDDSRQRRWGYWAQVYSRQECEDISLPQQYEIAQHKIDRQFEIVRKEELKTIQLLRTIMVVVGVFSTFLGVFAGFFTVQTIAADIEGSIDAVIIVLSTVIIVFSVSYGFLFFILIPFEILPTLSPVPLLNPVSLLRKHLFSINYKKYNRDTSTMLHSGPQNLDQNRPILKQYQSCIEANDDVIENQREELRQFYEYIYMSYFLIVIIIIIGFISTPFWL